MLPEEDRIRLTHMRDEARRALAFAAGCSSEDLRADEMLSYAVTRALEVLGAAASQVSASTREAHPELPWASMVGMRNRLIHAYHDVNLQVVWKTLSDDLPPLIEALDELLGQG